MDYKKELYKIYNNLRVDYKIKTLELYCFEDYSYYFIIKDNITKSESEFDTILNNIANQFEIKYDDYTLSFVYNDKEFEPIGQKLNINDIQDKYNRDKYSNDEFYSINSTISPPLAKQIIDSISYPSLNPKTSNEDDTTQSSKNINLPLDSYNVPYQLAFYNKGGIIQQKVKVAKLTDFNLKSLLISNKKDYKKVGFKGEENYQ